MNRIPLQGQRRGALVPPKKLDVLQIGASLIEYVLITSVSMSALLMPFGDDNQSVIKRLLEAVRSDHSGYMYVAGLPSLPRSDTASGGIPGTAPGNGIGGEPAPTPLPPPGTNPQPGPAPDGASPPDAIPPVSGGGGGGSGPAPELPGAPGSPNPGLPDDGAIGAPTPAVPPVDGPGGPVIVGTPTDGGENSPPIPTPANPGGIGDGGFGPTPQTPINSLAGGGSFGGDPNNGAGQAQCLASEPLDGTSIFTPSNSSSRSSSSSAGFNGAHQPTSVAATHVGNPIHVATGNKYQAESDLPRLPGAMALSFTRHYNSRTPYRGALGHGWRHNFEVGLIEVQARQIINGTEQVRDRIYLWQADGRRIDFTALPRSRTAPDLPRELRRYQAAQYSDGELTAGPFGYQWRWRNNTVLDFAPNGKLKTITDASGQIFKLGYDHENRLIKLTDPQQRSIRLNYNRNGQLASVTDPGDQRIRYSYDADGNLSRVDYPDKTYKTYHYEDANDRNNLTGISIGRSGQATSKSVRIATWTYDAQDRALSSERRDGQNKVTLEFDPDGHQTTVTDPSGQPSLYQTSGQQSPVATVGAIYGPGCNACGPGDVSYTYNERMQVIEMRFKDGSGLGYKYDQWGRTLAATVKLPGDHESVEFAGFRYLNDTHKVTQMRIPSIRPGHWRTIDLAYDKDQRPVSATETGFAPRPDGSFSPITRSQHFKYRGRNGPLIAVDGYREDIADLLLIQWEDEGASKTVFPDGQSFEILGVDSLGRASRVQTDQSSQPLELLYNAQGEISRVSNGKRSIQLDYGPAGQLAALQIGKQRIALTSDWERKNSESPQAEVLAYARSLLPEGLRHRHLVSFTDARGNQTRYAFDDFGRRVFVMSPDTGLSQYAFDGDNNLLNKTDANGQQARFEYDASGHVVKALIGEQRTDFQWQGPPDRRHPGSIRTADQHETITLGPQGKVAESTQTYGEHRYTTRYHYNERGQIHEKQLPDGRSLIYRYHANGALSAIEQKSRLPLKPHHPLLSGLNDESPEQIKAGIADWQALNGITTTIKRDRNSNQLAGIRIGRLHDLRYRYANLGKIQGKITGIDDKANRSSHRYRYDDQGRIDLAITPDALYGYHYDANGNRTRLIVNGQHIKYRNATDSNRLNQTNEAVPPWHPPMPLSPLTWTQSTKELTSSQHRNTSIQYLPSGEMTRLGNIQIDYNANGQPEALYQGDIPIAQYQYNSRAQRISKKFVYGNDGDWTTTSYLYENNRLSAEINEQGKITRQYLYLGHHPVAILEMGQNYAVHTNHLGAPIAVTDQNQTVIWHARYAPFGKAQVNEDPDRDGQNFTLNLRLPGQYFDQESDLHYNHHRYYDPNAGRYISSDPLGLAAGPNTYAYVENDPVNFIDPTGLLLFAFDGTGNNNPPEGNSDISNVVRFRDTYLADPRELGVREETSESNDHFFYMSGAGTRDSRSGIEGGELDAGNGYSLPDRIARLADDFFDYIHWHRNRSQYGGGVGPSSDLNLDVVGFSRGAASARIFANLLGAFLDGKDEFVLERSSDRRYDFRDGYAASARRYISGACLNITLRFLGLWDTVPHYDLRNQDDDLYQLDLDIAETGRTDAFKHVAHAVAVNEDRKDFHGVSIHPHPEKTNSPSRVELGFVGAHSDIGGGYAEGDLSDVAFMWMVKQAKAAGVQIDDTEIREQNWHEINVPSMHDSVGVNATPIPGLAFEPGRNLKYTIDDVAEVSQKQWKGHGMNYTTAEEGNYYDQRYIQNGKKMKDHSENENRTLVGIVDGGKYSRWLKDNYQLDVVINDKGLRNGLPPPIRP